MASALSAPHLHNEEAAYAYVEARLWPNGPVCPRCNGTERIGKLQGKSTRMGVYKCYACRKPFTVKVGTIFEDSKIALHVWLQAIFLMAGSKKGISTHQLRRTLGVTIKTAWFLSQRVREGMREGALAPMGGIVEVDECYLGRKEGHGVPRGGVGHKMKVLSLVQRGGAARSMVFDRTSAAEIIPLVRQNVSAEAHVMTDDHAIYRHSLKGHFADHSIVRHQLDEYVVGNAYTNTVEGFFSIFKRGMRGVYQHCRERHLHHYLAEFDFRYTYREATGYDDAARADRLLKGFAGKRLTYGRVGAA
jgi:transposase-like protein